MAVTVSVEGGDLAVRATGWDAVWALTRGVRVPLSAVRSVTVVPPKPALRAAGLRVMGTYVPRTVAAGRFWRPRHRELWLARWPERVLAIDCARPPAGFDRVVAGVADPDGTAALLAGLIVR